MTSENIAAQLEPCSSIPLRPEMYALAAIIKGKWSLSYGGMPRRWIEGSQQPLYPGSFLVIVPAAQPPAVAAEENDDTPSDPRAAEFVAHRFNVAREVVEAIKARKVNYCDGDPCGCPACGWFESHKPDCALVDILSAPPAAKPGEGDAAMVPLENNKTWNVDAGECGPSFIEVGFHPKTGVMIVRQHFKDGSIISPEIVLGKAVVEHIAVFSAIRSAAFLKGKEAAAKIVDPDINPNKYGHPGCDAVLRERAAAIRKIGVPA